MKLEALRKFSRHLVHSSHVAVLIAMTVVSPVAFTLQIELHEDMKVRFTESLTEVGMLAAGSVVEIPDQFKKLGQDGKVDADATFKNWLENAGFNQQQIDQKVTNPRKDFYFPVRIVSMAPRSRGKNLIGRTRFMALRVLEHSHGGMKVKEDAPVYQGLRKSIPIKPADPAKKVGKSAEDTAHPAPKAPAPTAKTGTAAPKPKIEVTPPVAKPVASAPAPKAKSAEGAARPAPVAAKPAPVAKPQPAQPAAKPAPSAPKLQPPAVAVVPPKQKVAPPNPPPAKSQSSDVVVAPAPAHPKKPVIVSPPHKDDAMEAQGAVVDCPDCHPHQPADDVQAGIGGTLPTLYNSESKGLQPLGAGFADACSDFIKKDGSYGPWGQKIVKEMMNSKHDGETSDFLANWDMSNSNAQAACPNFNQFTDTEKRHFWVYAIAALSMQEATCDQDATAPLSTNENGHAVGLLQIEEIATYRRGRDVVYGGRFCSGPDPKEVNLNLRCGMRMIDDVVQLRHGPYEIKTASHAGFENYYSSFRRSNTLAKDLISQYAACGAKRVHMVKHHRHRKKHKRSQA